LNQATVKLHLLKNDMTSNKPQITCQNNTLPLLKHTYTHTCDSSRRGTKLQIHQTYSCKSCKSQIAIQIYLQKASAAKREYNGVRRLNTKTNGGDTHPPSASARVCPHSTDTVWINIDGPNRGLLLLGNLYIWRTLKMILAKTRELPRFTHIPLLLRTSHK